MGDLEKAKREIRWAKSAADDRRWDQLEPKIQAIDEALKGVPEADAAPVLAELQPLREKLIAGVREEKAGRIEREIRRNLSAAADDLNRGYKESPQLPKTIARLDSAEAREALSPETLAKLHAEIAALQAKSGGAPPPPPPPPKPAAPAVNEQAQAIENEVGRNLRFAADEMSRNPGSCESYLARSTTKLDSPEAKQNLSAEAMQRLRGQIADLKSKLDASQRAEKAGAIEREIRRFLGGAADELNRGYKESPQLAKAIARLDSAEARQVLAADLVARLQAEIAPLQPKSAGSAPPPPPPPKPAGPASSEQAQAIENEIGRNLRFAADEMSRNPGSCESYLTRSTAKLESPEAAQHLSAEAMQRLRAQVAELRSKLDASQRAEKAGAIEREIRRCLSAAADELDRGYKDSPQLAKAMTRLNSADAREVLAADVVAKLEAEIAPLHAKSTVPAPPPPPPPKAAPAVSTAAPAVKPAPAAAAAPVLSEQARLIESDISRGLRFVEGDIDVNPLQCESGISRAETKLDSDDVKQHLPAEVLERLRTKTADLRARFEAAKRADKVRTLEGFIGRFIRNAEEDLGHNRRQAGEMLDRGSERLDRGDAKELLSADSIAKFRSEIARVQKLLDAATRKDGLDRAHPILKELEERVQAPIFGGSQQPWQVLGDLDSLKSRVRGALHEVPQDDPEVKAIEKRIAAVDATIAGQTAKLGRDQAHARVAQLWELEQKAIAGWEDETGGDAKAPAYEMPRTASAVRRLTWFLNDSDIKSIGAEHKSDKDIQAMLADAKKIRETAVAKLHAAFTAVVAFLEKQPRPSNRFDLEKPAHLAGQAGSDFEGTPHKDANVARAKGLYDRWQAEIEADRKARQAKYDELSVQAAAAWPRILSKIKAEEEFDPTDSGSRGRTVLIKGLRNRIGWDFSGAYDFAVWVNETPVVGNFDKTVAAAVNEAFEKVGLPLDDHTDWDAVIVVGGPGKIKERFNIVVRDRNNLEIGKIEEWRPVPCVMCTVVALRAGPVSCSGASGA